MQDGANVLEFGQRILERLEAIVAGLPVGHSLDLVTYQAEQVEKAVYGVTANVAQTLVIVLVVVVLLLGLRTGLIGGAIVPIVMLSTLAVMGFSGLPLERMSLATLVIALGLLVDAGVVVVEDYKNRLSSGESRTEALEGAGSELSLLSSTATAVLVLPPLMLADHVAGENTRSISIVIAITLSIPWLLAMTVTPVLSTTSPPATTAARRPIASGCPSDPPTARSSKSKSKGRTGTSSMRQPARSRTSPPWCRAPSTSTPTGKTGSRGSWSRSTRPGRGERASHRPMSRNPCPLTSPGEPRPSSARATTSSRSWRESWTSSVPISTGCGRSSVLRHGGGDGRRPRRRHRAHPGLRPGPVLLAVPAPRAHRRRTGLIDSLNSGRHRLAIGALPFWTSASTGIGSGSSLSLRFLPGMVGSL